MIFDTNFSRESYLNNLDPRSRLLVCIIFAISAAVSSRLETLLTFAAFSILFAILAKLNLKKLLIRLFFVNIFIIFLWFFLPFTTPGDVIWNFHSLEVTSEGVLLSACITVRANSIILLIISLVSTIPFENLGFALQKLYLPEKLVFIFLFTIRYLNVIESEKERLINAAKTRGFKPAANLHTYKTIACFIGMLFVKSIDRAERVHQAMLCRGFNGTFYSLKHFVFRKRDAFFLLISFFLIAAAVIIENRFFFFSL